VTMERGDGLKKRLKVGFPTLAGDAVGLTNRLHLAVQARLFGFSAFCFVEPGRITASP
jgi:hypothetical protein